MTALRGPVLNHKFVQRLTRNAQRPMPTLKTTFPVSDLEHSGTILKQANDALFRELQPFPDFSNGEVFFTCDHINHIARLPRITEGHCATRGGRYSVSMQPA